jgi:hypothetical protein
MDVQGSEFEVGKEMMSRLTKSCGDNSTTTSVIIHQTVIEHADKGSKCSKEWNAGQDYHEASDISSDFSPYLPNTRLCRTILARFQLNNTCNE